MGKKTFYTDRDIEDLANRGVHSLDINDDVYLTDVAREKADRLGVTLIREHDTPSSAPIRPYVAAEVADRRENKPPTRTSTDDMFQQVRTAVINRVGEDVDTDLIDTIIRRVLANI